LRGSRGSAAAIARFGVAARGTPDAPDPIVRPVGLAITTSVGLVAGAGFVQAPSHPTRWIDHYRATVVEVPRGTVELASFGTVELSPDAGAPISAMHVRMIVSNNADDRPWTLDASQSRLEIAGARVAATFANSNLNTLPYAIVARGERAVIDCYFALPANTREPTELTIAWALRTPDSTSPQRTRLTVDDIPALRAASALPAGWGRRWWFDRDYPWPSFVRDSGILAHRPPAEVAVSRPPVRYDRRNTEGSASRHE
jgi:hypothetical protein